MRPGRTSSTWPVNTDSRGGWPWPTPPSWKPVQVRWAGGPPTPAQRREPHVRWGAFWSNRCAHSPRRAPGRGTSSRRRPGPSVPGSHPVLTHGRPAVVGGQDRHQPGKQRVLTTLREDPTRTAVVGGFVVAAIVFTSVAGLVGSYMVRAAVLALCSLPQPNPLPLRASIRGNFRVWSCWTSTCRAGMASTW